MHRSFSTCFAAAAVVFVSFTAHADEQGTPNQPPPPTPAPVAAPPTQVPSYTQYRRRRPESENVWYGWQTLLADGATSILGIALSRADNNLGGGVALGGYLLGGPVVHWAHGNVGKGFADLGIRIAMPLVLGLAGYALGSIGNHPYDDNGAQVAGLAIGVTLGVGGAIAIDAAVLAREKRHPDEDEDHASDGQTPAFHAAAPRSRLAQPDRAAAEEHPRLAADHGRRAGLLWRPLLTPSPPRASSPAACISRS